MVVLVILVVAVRVRAVAVLREFSESIFVDTLRFDQRHRLDLRLDSAESIGLNSLKRRVWAEVQRRFVEASRETIAMSTFENVQMEFEPKRAVSYVTEIAETSAWTRTTKMTEASAERERTFRVSVLETGGVDARS